MKFSTVVKKVIDEIGLPEDVFFQDSQKYS